MCFFLVGLGGAGGVTDHHVPEKPQDENSSWGKNVFSIIETFTWIPL